ncbi:hypothetical protein NDU88_001816 [Pleurodeles waltl]|uniref:Uncharacterized protein n=1 Tax=Pleurodeles waltl TaxID=8319 RepID=A0AAV7W139_PLEWA|nr:hypothetical protein NDU88_001816 [Pleurodeles waltl]
MGVFAPVPGEDLRCSGEKKGAGVEEGSGFREGRAGRCCEACQIAYEGAAAHICCGDSHRGGDRDKVLRTPSGTRSVKSVGGALLEVPSTALKELKEEKVGPEGPKKGVSSHGQACGVLGRKGGPVRNDLEASLRAAPHVMLQGTHDNAETLHSRDHKKGEGRQREQGCHSADFRSGELGGAGEGSMEVGSA